MSLNNNHDDPNTTAEKTTFEHHLYNNNRNDSQLTEVEDDRDYTSCSSSIKHDTSNQVHPSSHQVDYDSISLDGQVDDVDSLSSVSLKNKKLLFYNNLFLDGNQDIFTSLI
jgi:hypothetical protein